MRIPGNKAQRAAVYFLVLLCGAFLALFAYFIYGKFGPRKIEILSVPFGIAPGTEISVGDFPDTLSGISALPASTAQELRRAYDLEKNDRLDEAAEIYEAIALQYPGVFLPEWGVARSLLAKDSLSSVWKSLLESTERSLKKRYPESSVAFWLEASLAEKANSPGTALELARVATEKSPAFFDARLLYAKLLFLSGRLAEGKGEVRVAISLSLGENPKAYALLSRIYHDEGSLDSCERVVDYALSKFPINPELLCMQGILQEYKGRFDEAENTYRRVLAIRPGFSFATESLLSLGQKSPPGRMESGRLSPRDQAKVACDILEPLVSRYPDNLPLREALGIAYLKGREFDRAKSQFLEIQTRDPDYPEIQRRLQEASSVPPVRDVKKNMLADDLHRAIDSMRTLPSTGHSFESLLGHYLVRYGASPKEFFARYSASNFKKVRKGVWREVFFEAPYFHEYTVLFDEKSRFYGVHVVVTDSNVVANKATNTPEIYTTLLQLNSRISGLGTETGETECDGTVLSGATWETRDNFEMLARVVGKPAEVRMIRLDKSKIPEGMRLCDYSKYLFMD